MYNPQVRVVDLDPCMGKFVDVHLANRKNRVFAQV